MFKKIFNLFKFFDLKSRRRLIYMQILILISSALEILSIFSIGPLVQVLSNPSVINEQDQLISKVYNFFEFSSFEIFLFFLVVFIFCIILVSTIILTFTLYILSMFSQKLGNILRSSLFKFYISQPWIYHARSNSSEYIRNVFYEANRTTTNIIVPVLLTNSRILTGAMVVVALTIYNPVASIICFLAFGFVYGLIFQLVKIRLSVHGTNQSLRMKQMYRVMNESFVGIKEAIIYGNQKRYFDEFDKNGLKYSNSAGKVSFLAQAPRYTLEFLAFSVILFFIVFLIYFGKANFIETLPVLSIYIFAGYKLLPIFQFIYTSLVIIRANIVAYDKIEKELVKSKNYTLKRDDVLREKLNVFKNVEHIIFNNVSFSYSDDSKKAVKDINLSLKKNSLNYIVGPSGSGKSTILDLILGLIYAQKGFVEIGKKELNDSNCIFWHENISYVGQNIFLIDDTIKNNICFADNENNIDEERLKKALDLSYTSHFLSDLPNGVDTIVGQQGIRLSGGQRQRVALARAFYQDKKIIVLDEATGSLDGIAEKIIIDNLKYLSKNSIIIMVTHNVKLCKAADLIYLLDNGSIEEFGDYNKLKDNKLFLKLLNEN